MRCRIPKPLHLKLQMIGNTSAIFPVLIEDNFFTRNLGCNSMFYLGDHNSMFYHKVTQTRNLRTELDVF